MMAGAHSPNTLMIRKLESIALLSAEERQALQDLPVQVMVLRADQDIVRIGDSPSQSCLLLEGFTCVYKLTAEGKRQIMALHVPGDIPDLQSLHLKVMDNSVATMTPCTVGFIQHEDLCRVCDRYPRITAALWRETLVDASIFREWLLNVGGVVTLTRSGRIQASPIAYESSGNARRGFPFRHGAEAVQARGRCRAAGARWNEEIADGREDADEPLQPSGRSKTLHHPLSPAKRQMRILCAIVEPLV
jgi:CRP-like cAMP-binding protein